MVFTSIKLFFTIKSIKYWETQFRDYFFIKNDFSIEHAFFLSYSMDFFCGSFASFSYPLKELRKIQQRATIWITGTFHTLPTWGIKAITELILIYLYIQKISRRHQLCISSLSTNHVINFILENRHAKNSPTYCLSLENMTIKQWQKIKSSIVNTNNCFNGIFPSFDSLNYEFSPGFRLIDNFPSCLFFHWANHKNKESYKTHLCKLDKIF